MHSMVKYNNLITKSDVHIYCLISKMCNIVTSQFLIFWEVKYIFNIRVSLVVYFSCVLDHLKWICLLLINRIFTYSCLTDIFDRRHFSRKLNGFLYNSLIIARKIFL